jgi:hypothetical protein
MLVGAGAGVSWVALQILPFAAKVIFPDVGVSLLALDQFIPLVLGILTMLFSGFKALQL